MIIGSMDQAIKVVGRKYKNFRRITRHAIRRGALRDLAHLKSHMDRTLDKEADVSAGHTSLIHLYVAARLEISFLDSFNETHEFAPMIRLLENINHRY